MNFKLFLVNQINFGFDNCFCFLENRFQRIGFNLKRDIFNLIHFWNFVFKFRYFWRKNGNICFRLLLNCLNFLISFLSDLSNLFIFYEINLRNLLFIRLFDRLKRCNSEWAIWINFVGTKISLLIEVTVVISKTSWAIECFAFLTKCFYFFALMIGTSLCMNFFAPRDNLVFKILVFIF